MSTKAKIQKIQAEIEAHERRGWLKGYEEGLAKREEQVVELQAALETRKKTIREMREALKKRNETSSAPTTARAALALAWELAHPVREGQQIPFDMVCLHDEGDRITMIITPQDWTPTFPDSVRTLDPLPDPEPDWLDAPAVLATEPGTGKRGVFIPTDKATGMHWAVVSSALSYPWQELEDVTPLYPKEDA